ncbi:MAG: MmgE/PrpD family protein [Dehalococcoidales bacterium]|nr:MmgE/PrpD family protein [Dehalococcoidales bacterium]
MNTNSENTILDKIITTIMETRFEDINQATIDHAKNRITDVVGCLIGGATEPSNLQMLDIFKDFGGKPESTILIYGDKVPAQNAAMLNSLMARSFDFEPVSPMVDGTSFPGHISGTTVMTALTMGEVADINGRELITSLLLGDDIAARILIASGFEFDQGWDNIGTVNAFGTTAITGRLLGLDRRQIRNAFGIVLNQIAGSLQIVWDGTTSFKLCQGLSARSGIFSTRLAKAGWTGPDDALFGQFGYYNLYTKGCKNPQALTKELGKEFYSDGTFKPYPCCRITHGPIDCSLALVNKYGLAAEDIQEVIVYASAGVLKHICGQPFRIGDYPHANAAFNIRYTVATALLRKSVRPEHFTLESINDPALMAFTKIIKMSELPEADLSRVKVKVITKDGREHLESTEIPRGDPQNPLSKEELIDKFWTNVEFGRTVTRENAKKALEMIENLENLNSVRDLTRLLVV